MEANRRIESFKDFFDGNGKHSGNGYKDIYEELNILTKSFSPNSTNRIDSDQKCNESTSPESKQKHSQKILHHSQEQGEEKGNDLSPSPPPSPPPISSMKDRNMYTKEGEISEDEVKNDERSNNNKYVGDKGEIESDLSLKSSLSQAVHEWFEKLRGIDEKVRKLEQRSVLKEDEYQNADQEDIEELKRAKQYLLDVENLLRRVRNERDINPKPIPEVEKSSPLPLSRSPLRKRSKDENNSPYDKEKTDYYGHVDDDERRHDLIGKIHSPQKSPHTSLFSFDDIKISPSKSTQYDDSFFEESPLRKSPFHERCENQSFENARLESEAAKQLYGNSYSSHARSSPPVFMSSSFYQEPDYPESSYDEPSFYSDSEAFSRKLNDVSISDIIRDIELTNESIKRISPTSRRILLKEDLLPSKDQIRTLSISPKKSSTRSNIVLGAKTKSVFGKPNSIPSKYDPKVHSLHKNSNLRTSLSSDTTRKSPPSQTKLKSPPRRFMAKHLNDEKLRESPKRRIKITAPSDRNNRSNNSTPSGQRRRNSEKSNLSEISPIPYSNVRHLHNARIGTKYNHSTIGWYMDLCSDKYARNPSPAKTKVKWVGMSENHRTDIL